MLLVVYDQNRQPSV